jgi:hypothetical protein
VAGCKFDRLFQSRTHVKNPGAVPLCVASFRHKLRPTCTVYLMRQLCLLLPFLYSLEDHTASTCLCVWLLGNQFSVFDL